MYNLEWFKDRSVKLRKHQIRWVRFDAFVSDAEEILASGGMDIISIAAKVSFMDVKAMKKQFKTLMTMLDHLIASCSTPVVRARLEVLNVDPERLASRMLVIKRYSRRYNRARKQFIDGLKGIRLTSAVGDAVHCAVFLKKVKSYAELLKEQQKAVLKIADAIDAVIDQSDALIEGMAIEGASGFKVASLLKRREEKKKKDGRLAAELLVKVGKVA